MRQNECKNNEVGTRAKTTNRISLFLILALCGVYSVSSETSAYPLSKSTSGSDASDDSGLRPVKPAKKSESSNSRSVSAPMAPGTHNLSLALGQVFLFGEPGTHGENAIGFDAHYAYGVSDLFAFQGNFGYSSHSVNTQSFSVSHLEAGLRTNLVYFDQLVPFFTVGLGFYHPSVTYAPLVAKGPNPTLGSVLFGLQLGAGVDLFVTNAVFFGTRLTYNDMFDSTKEDSAGITRNLGGSFISFMIHAGMTF